MKRFNLLHPAAVLLYFIFLMFLLFANSGLIHRAAAAAGLAALAFFFAGFQHTAKALRWTVPLGLMVVLLNPLFNRRGQTVLFYLWGGSVTLESVVIGVCQALMLIGIVLLFVSFNKVIDQSAFLYLIGKRMPRAALLLNLSLQTSARLSRRAKEFMDTQRVNARLADAQYAEIRQVNTKLPNVRYVSVSYRSIKMKLQYALNLLSAFLAGSLEEGMEMAEVLKARDYGTARRTRYRFYHFKARDAVILSAAVVLFAASFFFYPAFVIYFLFPVIIEAGRRTGR